jgi:hypothetical protein
LHQGLRSKLTLIKPGPGEARQVLRVFGSTAEVADGEAGRRVYLLSLTMEVLSKRFLLLSLPSTRPAASVEVSALLKDLKSAPNAVLLAQTSEGNEPAAVFQAKP